MSQSALITHTTAIICCYVALVIYCVLLVSILYNYIGKTLGFIGIWSMISISLLAASCAALAWMLQTADMFVKWYIADALYDFLWSLGTLSIYFLFIKRLQITFDGTKYSLPAKTYKMLYLGCALFEFIWCLAGICYYLKLGHILEPAEYDQIAVVSNVTALIIDLVTSITIIILFIQRLRKLNIEVGSGTINKAENSSLNKSQMKIVLSMSKVTILSCVAILSTQSYLIYCGLLYSAGQPEIPNNIRYILVSLDCVINSICVVLSFDFADEWYHKLCCCCECCCTRLCAYQAKREFNRYKQRLISEPYTL